MQRIVNDPQYCVEDMLKGILKHHKDLLCATDNSRALKYAKAPIKGKVGIVTGGGSGHEPAFLGYVGKNMCDAVAVGEIFSSPTAQAFYDAFVAADAGAGVVCLYGNYAGDNMNVRMAMEMAEDDGIVVKRVVANDDVPSAPKTEREKRRGVAGEIMMWKCAGAFASTGASIDEVVRVAQKAIDSCRSIGIGLAPCTLPAVGKPNFFIKEGTMELGIGHHGEPGIKVTELVSAKEMAKIMVDTILPDYPFVAGDDVAVLISGLGATPLMEQYILFDEVDELLKAAGINVYRSFVANYFTSLEMQGVTLTVMKLDDELKPLIDAPTHCIGLTQVSD